MMHICCSKETSLYAYARHRNQGARTEDNEPCLFNRLSACIVRTPLAVWYAPEQGPIETMDSYPSHHGIPALYKEQELLGLNITPSPPHPHRLHFTANSSFQHTTCLQTLHREGPRISLVWRTNLSYTQYSHQSPSILGLERACHRYSTSVSCCASCPVFVHL